MLWSGTKATYDFWKSERFGYGDIIEGHRQKTLERAKEEEKTVIIWIAKLGGFLGRKKDGEPRVKCLWRGLRSLFDIAQTWKLAKSPSNKNFKT